MATKQRTPSRRRSPCRDSTLRTLTERQLDAYLETRETLRRLRALTALTAGAKQTGSPPGAPAALA